MSLVAVPDRLARYARRVFAPLPRADQRRWAETYIRGLLTARGRKSVRNIAAGVDGQDAVQSLQQFVSQSPWEWAPVRERVTRRAIEQVAPEAWMVEPVFIPKRGAASVGVTRRFVHSIGRSMNCQTGMGLFAVSSEAGFAANWRIVLPPSWLTEDNRRLAGVPGTETGGAEWEYVVEMIDEVLGEWQLEPLPIVIDMRNIDGVLPLLEAFHARGLRYVVRISAGLRGRLAGPYADVPTGTDAGPLGDVVRLIDPRRREVVAWWDAQHHTIRRSKVNVSTVRLLDREPDRGSLRPGGQVRTHLLAIWSSASDDPGAYLLSNLPPAETAGILQLARLPGLRRPDVERLRDFGLVDFEGRTYRGWHHHATLVSAAMTFAQIGEHQAHDRMPAIRAAAS